MTLPLRPRTPKVVQLDRLCLSPGCVVVMGRRSMGRSPFCQDHQGPLPAGMVTCPRPTCCQAFIKDPADWNPFCSKRCLDWYYKARQKGRPVPDVGLDRRYQTGGAAMPAKTVKVAPLPAVPDKYPASMCRKCYRDGVNTLGKPNHAAGCPTLETNSH